MHLVDTDAFAEVTTVEKESNGSSSHGERINIVVVSTITSVILTKHRNTPSLVFWMSV